MGLYLLLPPPLGIGLLNMWFVLPLVIVGTVILLRYLTRGELQENLKRQYQIFKDKHTWAMTVIYTMTFGSFIGYSAAFPLSIKVIFGFTHVMGPDGTLVHDAVNPNGPSALMFAWMGPFIGALIRPIGGKIADKVGGAKGHPDRIHCHDTVCSGGSVLHERGLSTPPHPKPTSGHFSYCSSSCLQPPVSATARPSEPLRWSSIRNKPVRRWVGHRPSRPMARSLFPRCSVSRSRPPRRNTPCTASPCFMRSASR